MCFRHHFHVPQVPPFNEGFLHRHVRKGMDETPRKNMVSVGTGIWRKNTLGVDLDGTANELETNKSCKRLDCPSFCMNQTSRDCKRKLWGPVHRSEQAHQQIRSISYWSFIVITISIRDHQNHHNDEYKMNVPYYDDHQHHNYDDDKLKWLYMIIMMIIISSSSWCLCFIDIMSIIMMNIIVSIIMNAPPLPPPPPPASSSTTFNNNQSINQPTNLPNQPTNPPTNQPTNPSLKPLLIWKQVSFENTRPPIRGSSHGGPHRHLLVVFLTTSCSWQILFPQGPADCNWLAIASLYIYIKWIIILSFEVHEPLNEVWIWKRRGIWVTIPGCDRNMMEPGPVHPDQNVGEKWIVLTNLCANIVLQKKSSTMYLQKKTSRC